MGGLFGGGGGSKMPAMAPPPAPAPAPTVDRARDNLINQQEAAVRKGRAATILTSNAGDLSATSTSKKQLGA